MSNFSDDSLKVDVFELVDHYSFLVKCRDNFNPYDFFDDGYIVFKSRLLELLEISHLVEVRLVFRGTLIETQSSNEHILLHHLPLQAVNSEEDIYDLYHNRFLSKVKFYDIDLYDLTYAEFTAYVFAEEVEK